jgi:hypothetical protein
LFIVAAFGCRLSSRQPSPQPTDHRGRTMLPAADPAGIRA